MPGDPLGGVIVVPPYPFALAVRHG
jgi:hypothetical protein